MKIAVMNFSGNVGKTTVAAHLLLPRLAGAKLYSVETTNADASADGVTTEKMIGREYGVLQDELMDVAAAVVDVGSSNAGEFVKLMQQHTGSHEELDYIVVPAVKDAKALTDTVNTLRTLAAIGVPRTKVRVLLNRVELDDNVERAFAPLFGLAAAEKSFVLNPAAVLHTNEAFDLMKGVRRSLADIAADTTDYRAKLRETTDPDARDLCKRMVTLKRLAVSAQESMDVAYRALFAKRAG